MTNKTGISIKKTKFFNKKVKTDLKKILTALSKAAIMYYAGKPESAFKELASIIDAFKFSEDASDLAYQLILTALVNSAHNLAKENSNRFRSELEVVEKLYDVKQYVEFLDGITSLIEEEETVLEYESLKNPRSIEILHEFKGYFSDYLILFGIPTTDAKLISNRLPSYFVFELNNEWRNNYAKYEILIQKLDAPTAEAARRERQWEAYYTYLEREAEKPVFGESFSLKDIFIPLRAYFQIKKVDRSGTRKIEKEVVQLEETMDKWLESSKHEEVIKVIQGGPGSGKSSFAKCWTAKIAKNRSVPVLFFPLHHFNIHSNIKNAIGEYFEDAANIPISFNPLEDELTSGSLLLVFDGLDELVIREKERSSEKAASVFMQALKDFCNLKNEGKQRIKVLVTGRPIAIQDTEAKLRDNKEQILHLLPYFVNFPQSQGYIDPAGLLALDQRNIWWNRFFAFKGLANNNLPVELRSKNIEKITTEPLLNYLVALSWKDAPEKFNENTNINDIYHQLIIGVFQRGWENKRRYKGLGDLTDDNFIQILEEIAICAWQGGDARVTTERKIEKHIKDRGLEDILEAYKVSAKGGVSRLLTAFYFQKFGKEESETKDDTFEFTHKSFGEYLTARGIVELIKLTHEEREKNKEKVIARRNKKTGWTIQECLKEWLKITGMNSLDHGIIRFIFDEVRLRNKIGEPIDMWHTTLCEVINELIYEGMPVHLLEHRMNLLEEIRIARNAEEALLVVLMACAHYTRKLSKLNWGEGKYSSQPAIWLNRVSSSLYNNDIAFQYLDYLDLSGTSLNFGSFKSAYLRSANLSNAMLTFTVFCDAKLEYADLSGADLSGAVFFKAKLRKAKFSGAKLVSVDFTEANLIDADMSGADFHNANLSNAVLFNVDLTDAKNLSKEQYLQANGLHGAIGIPDEIKAWLMQKKPKLFSPPMREIIGPDSDYYDPFG